MTTPFKYAHAVHADWTQAAQACMGQLGAIPVGATLGFLYVSDAFVGELYAILAFFQSATGVPHWTGSVGVGVCATGVEYLDAPAMAVMLGLGAFFGVKAIPEVKRFLYARRYARTVELIQARGEVSYQDIGRETGLAVQDAAILLHQLLEHGDLMGYLDDERQWVTSAAALAEKQRRMLGAVASHDTPGASSR